jgi:peptidoglycan hydrolase-like protein with peptidoglycan-binding domain
MKKLTTSSLILLATVGFVGGAVSFVQAQSTSFIPCGFTRDLEVGAVGEEVRCLQKYLNDNGYKIADSGVGSPGHETNLFGSLTAETVRRWQTAQGVPSTGYFGPKSQEAYLKHVSTLASAQVATVSPTIIPAAPAPLNSVPTSWSDKEQKQARDLIGDIREQIDDLEDSVDDVDNVDDRNDLKDDLDDAKDDLIDLLYSFVDEDYSEVISRGQDIKDSLDDAGTAVYGDKDKADRAIQDAEEDIDNATNEIDDADDDGDHVDNARDLLDEANDKLKDANREFKRKKYSEAKSLAHEASDLADRAVDSIGD